MTMQASILATGLRNLTPVATEAEGVASFVRSWSDYFAFAQASSLINSTGFSVFEAAMTAELSGMSDANQAATAIPAGITAWWAAMIPLASTLFGGTVITPPAGVTPAAIQAVFDQNLADDASLVDATNDIADLLHAGNLGGTVVIGPSTIPIV